MTITTDAHVTIVFPLASGELRKLDSQGVFFLSNDSNHVRITAGGKEAHVTIENIGEASHINLYWAER